MAYCGALTFPGCQRSGAKPSGWISVKCCSKAYLMPWKASVPFLGKQTHGESTSSCCSLMLFLTVRYGQLKMSSGGAGEGGGGRQNLLDRAQCLQVETRSIAPWMLPDGHLLVPLPWLCEPRAPSDNGPGGLRARFYNPTRSLLGSCHQRTKHIWDGFRNAPAIPSVKSAAGRPGRGFG